METETKVNSTAGSPNLPVIDLKIEPKEENDSRFDQLEVASWSEDVKHINLSEDFDSSSAAKGSCTEYEPGIFKTESDESNGSNYGRKNILKSETIEQEEVHIIHEIKYESEESESNKKTQKPEEQLLSHQCTECPYRTAKKFYLNLHSIKHKTPDEIDWYNCQECPYKTYRKDRLKTHAEIHNNLMLKCSKCSYETLRAANMKRHQIKHKTDIDCLHCSECSYKTYHPPDFRKHSLVHRSGAFKCPKCSYQSRTKYQLAVHQVKHETMDKWHSCPLCSYKTYNKKIIKTHCLRRHSVHPNNPKQIIEIKKCSYEGRLKRGPKMHQRIHDQNNMLQCSECAYKTPYKDSLKKHKVRHHGEDSEGWHKCVKCPFKAPSYSKLQKHLISHKSIDEIQWLKCLRCSFKTAYKYSLQHHQLKHKNEHEVEWFCCYECSYKTVRKQTLARHLSTHRKRIKDII